MALAPLRSGSHTMRADRLAFATPVPVREAGREGWITLHAHGEEDEGTVHVYVGSGGYIEKGPKALTHQHIGAIASHPSVARTTRHPAGHEPPGARDHPDFHEAGPKPRTAPSVEGEEPARRPGKPYARLHGAEQGTRAEQVGKALSEAQKAATGAKARPQESDEDKLARLTTEMKDHETRANLARFTDRSKVAHHEAEQQRLRRELAAHRASMEHASQPTQAVKPLAPTSTATPAAGGVDHEAVEDFMAAGAGASAEKRQQMLQQVRVAVKAGKGAMGVNHATLVEMQRRLESPEHKIADAAVAHQQAQAALAAHRAAHDRNPNPWAPHLSPPVGDAKDRELAEKATRAQLAHQAAQAQAQGAQQQQQSAEQRAHEKEMVRLKAQTAQGTPHFSAPQAKEKPRAAPEADQPAGHEDLPPVSGAIADSVARAIKRVDKDNVEQIGRAHSDKQIEGTLNAIKHRYPAATVNHDEVAQRIHAATPTYRVNSGHAGRLQVLRGLKERIAKTHRVKGEEGHPLVQPAFKALDERIAHHAAQYQATLGRAKEEAGHAAEIMMAHQSAARASHQANSAAPQAAQPQAQQRTPAQQRHEARAAEHRARLALENQIMEHAQRQQHHSRQGAEPNHGLSIAHGSKKDQLLRQYRRQFGDDAYEGVLDRVEEAAGRKKVRESGSPADHFRAPVASAR